MTLDLALVFVLAIVAAPALLALATLAVLGSFVALLADGVSGGRLRRPS